MDDNQTDKSKFLEILHESKKIINELLIFPSKSSFSTKFPNNSKKCPQKYAIIFEYLFKTQKKVNFK